MTFLALLNQLFAKLRILMFFKRQAISQRLPLADRVLPTTSRRPAKWTLNGRLIDHYLLVAVAALRSRRLMFGGCSDWHLTTLACCWFSQHLNSPAVSLETGVLTFGRLQSFCLLLAHRRADCMFFLCVLGDISFAGIVKFGLSLQLLRLRLNGHWGLHSR